MFPLIERDIPHVEDKILSYLEPRDLAACRLVCREWSCKAKPFLYDWFGRKQRNKGHIPLIEATRRGHVDLVAYLLKDEQLDVNENTYPHSLRGVEWTAFFWAVHVGNVEIVKLLLQREDIDVNATNKDGHTPLIWAAWKGHASIAECLLQRPDVDINKQTFLIKSTALDVANIKSTELEGRRLIASMLEKRGAKRWEMTPV